MLSSAPQVGVERRCQRLGGERNSRGEEPSSPRTASPTAYSSTAGVQDMHGRLVRARRSWLPSSPSSWLPTSAPRLAPRRLRVTTQTRADNAPETDRTTTLAIVGAGLSGLSTAHHYLRQLSPGLRSNTRIVVLDKQERVGGWCRAVRVRDDDAHSKDGNNLLVFETGPRSIRPVGLSGWLTLQMASPLSPPSAPGSQAHRKC